MKILICSDGSAQAENATRFGGLIASHCHAETTILGITESPAEQDKIFDALKREQQLLAGQKVAAEVITKAGRPVVEISRQTRETRYDLVIVAAVRKARQGLFWMSKRTYRIIKAIEPPVLVVIGKRDKLKQMLVCSGGLEGEQDAVELVGQIAKQAAATATLFHVMAEPPAMYSRLLRMEDDPDLLLQSGTELAKNLKSTRESLEEAGASCSIRLAHGLVVPQIMKEVQREDYDLIVTGSYPAKGRLQNYMMGNITREIVNRADRPVLVVRSARKSPGLLRSLLNLTAELTR